MAASMVPVVVALLAITPESVGTLTPVATPINTQPGEQLEPRVDGDLAAYTDDNATTQIRFYNFATGVDSAIPTPVGHYDVLSDVDDGRIVFTRANGLTGTSAIMLFDVATNTVTELAPAPNASHFGVTIGGQTAAFIDYTEDPDTGDVVVLDLDTNALTRLTTHDGLYQQNVATSNDGDVVVYEVCETGTACDIAYARKTAAGWSLGWASQNPGRDTLPDVSGNRVVFMREDQSNLVLSADVVTYDLSTGEEVRYELPGPQVNPSIRGDVIAFESRPVDLSHSDLYLLQISTRRLFQITDTPDANESLNDVTVLPNGDVRVVWQSIGAGVGSHDIYGATFSLPGGPNECTASVVLEASRRYSPSRWYDDTESFSSAFSFEIPAELPVVEGSAGGRSGKAYLTFTSGTQTITCIYRGEDEEECRRHGRSSSNSNYVFDTCKRGGHPHGYGGGYGWGGGCSQGHSGNDGEDADDLEPGVSVEATNVKLHVHNGDGPQKTTVRVDLGGSCSEPLPQPDGGTGGGHHGGGQHGGGHHGGGCSSSGGALLPALMMLAAMSLLTRRRAISARATR